MEPAAVPPQAINSGSPAPSSNQGPVSLPVTQWGQGVLCGESGNTCLWSGLKSIQSVHDHAGIVWCSRRQWCSDCFILIQMMNLLIP